MKLVIAEKRDLAKAIAKGLSSSPKENKDTNSYESGGYTIAWCSGHILELKGPQDYQINYKKWRFEDLIIKELKLGQYKKSSDKRVQTLLKTLPQLLKKASLIVHAGDPDDEGQRIVDSVLEFFSVPKQIPVKRVAISDYNPKLISKAFKNLEDNNAPKWRGMSNRGYARAIADLVYGINLTRGLTIHTHSTHPLSVGRVQSPTLALVVKRYYDNQKFTSKNFYEILADFSFGDENNLTNAKLIFPDDTPKDEGKVTDYTWVQSLQKKLIEFNNKPQPSVHKFDTKEEEKNHPLVYDLLNLQAEAEQRFNIDPKKTLEITQDLRDKYQLITYNRSDCPYLNEINHADAPLVLQAIAHNSPNLLNFIDQCNYEIKSRVWNDQEVAKSSHHGIIPTESTVSPEKLNTQERIIYEMIASLYIAQFYPKKKVVTTDILVNYNGFFFQQKYSHTSFQGWGVLFNDDTDESESQRSSLSIQTGDLGLCSAVNIHTGKTTAPPLYTKASLLKTLPSVDTLVEDPQLKEFLIKNNKSIPKNQRGIGTPATRADIVQKLFDSKYVTTKNKKIIPTQLGLEMYEIMPSSSKTIDMSALWQLHLSKISSGDITVEAFVNFVSEIVEDELKNLSAQQIKISTSAKTATCNCGSIITQRLSKKNNSLYWRCDSCEKTYSDDNGSPNFNPVAKTSVTTNSKGESFQCEKCGEILAKRQKKGSSKSFWGCTAFPKCKAKYDDINDAPYFESCHAEHCEGHLFLHTYKGKEFWGCDQYSSGCKAKYKMGPNKEPVLIAESH